MANRNLRVLSAAAFAVASVLVSTSSSAQAIKGPSTASTPYIQPVIGGVETYSIFTAGPAGGAGGSIDTVGGYQMSGIPDGLGAFDNGNGTFTVLMNHELGATAGVVRAHGSAGAFVSKFTLNKNTLAVTAASDLVQTPFLWNGTGYSNAAGGAVVTNTVNPAILTTTAAFNRFCSADLPKISALSFGATGTTERLFMTGEESGFEGRAFAHIATGPNAGTSYELPRLGKFSWENAVASPLAQSKTVVFGTADTNAGRGIYLYVGDKTNTGNEVQRAGLTNGLLFAMKVEGGAPTTESRTTEFGIGSGSKPVSFVAAGAAGNVENLTGATVEAGLAAAGASVMLRPEDAAWDTKSNNTLYFATTDQYDQVKDGVGTQVGRSRLWKLVLNNMANPQAGGTLSILLDGSEASQMIDNLTVDQDGNIWLQEDVGNQQHNGKVIRYNPVTDTLQTITKHDAARFGDIGTNPTAPFSADEENSGIIEITDIMAGSALNTGFPGERWYLLDDQAHYSGGTSGITPAMVEGGQLQAIHVIPEPGSAVLLTGVAGLLTLRRRRAWTAR